MDLLRTLILEARAYQLTKERRAELLSCRGCRDFATVAALDKHRKRRVERTAIALVVEGLLGFRFERRSPLERASSALAFSNEIEAVPVNLADKFRRLFSSASGVLWSHCRPDWQGLSQLADK